MRPIAVLGIPFEKNILFDLEVWLNVRGKGLVGIEGCYRVISSGCERLSKLEKNIIIK